VSSTRPRSTQRPATLEDCLREYRGFARLKASAYFLRSGGDHADLEQEAMIGLWKAWRDFKPDAGASFRSFAELCITRQVITLVKTQSRNKHGPLTGAIPLHAPPPGDSGGGSTLADAIPDPGDAFHRAEALHDATAVLALIAARCTDLERRAVELCAWGDADYEQAAIELGVGVKSIDNALQRVKRKLLAAAREDLPSARHARVGVMKGAARAKMDKAHASFDQRVREVGARVAASEQDGRAHPDVTVRQASPEELASLRKRLPHEEQRECAECGEPFLPAEGRRRDPALRSLYVHIGDGCRRARAREQIRREREAKLADETTDGDEERREMTDETAGAGGGVGHPGSPSAPAPSPPDANRGRAPRDDHGGSHGPAPRFEREDLPTDRVADWEERILDQTGAARGVSIRRRAVVEEVLRDFGPRSQRLLEIELPFPDGQSGATCRRLVQLGVLRRTRLVRDWPGSGTKPSPEYEWVPVEQRTTTQLSTPGVGPSDDDTTPVAPPPGHDDGNAGSGRGSTPPVESRNGARGAEPSVESASGGADPAGPGVSRGIADDHLIAENLSLRARVARLEDDLAIARRLRPMYERDPAALDDYRDLLFEHAKGRPDCEHIFDRIERLLELGALDELTSGKQAVSNDTPGG
jgi:RNA polymerase sporulation-specific sigma factor